MASYTNSTSSNKPTVRVGVGVFVVRPEDGWILVGKRKNNHGNGGHLEFGESFEDCATREVKEETGLTIENVTFETATNDIMLEDGKHYVTIFMRGNIPMDNHAEPQVLEPEKCEFWKWMSYKELMMEIDDTQLFQPLQNLKRMAFTLRDSR